MNEIADILRDLCLAANKISNKIRTAGVDNLLGLNGKTNIYGDQVKKLDEIAKLRIKNGAFNLHRARFFRS